LAQVESKKANIKIDAEILSLPLGPPSAPVCRSTNRGGLAGIEEKKQEES